VVILRLYFTLIIVILLSFACMVKNYDGVYVVILLWTD